MAKLQAIRGMRDILMDETPRWQSLESIVRKVLGQYGYQEIRLPIVENTELFSRSIGDNTDIVSKEMYTFTDKNETSLTLRPEGTAGCVRAGIEHGLFHNQTQRLWYAGPMFRHERPQKGRQRQFHQIGVEAFGFQGPDIDIELITLCARLWKKLGIQDVRLEINSLGSSEARKKYRDILVSYFSDHQQQLDNDSQVRLQQNPLRILDSKNPEMQSLIAAAPSFIEHLDEASAEHFSGLKQGLDNAGIDYQVNPKLVRGLDYYGRTVFEWITDQLGAQGTVCAGGRYDGLVEQHGANSTPAIGFAIGVERLLELAHLENADNLHMPHVYLIIADDKAQQTARSLAETLRENDSSLRIVLHCGGGSLKSQFKKADKSGALFAFVIGEDELNNDSVTIKFLRENTSQTTIKCAEAKTFLKKQLITT